MLLQIDQAIVTVIEVLFISHRERRKYSQLILDGRMGKIPSSSLLTTATSCLANIELELIVFIICFYIL